jgi:hypothetical protein
MQYNDRTAQVKCSPKEREQFKRKIYHTVQQINVKQ